MHHSSLTSAIHAGILQLASSVAGLREARANPVLNIIDSGRSIVSGPLFFGFAGLPNTLEGSILLPDGTSQGPAIATWALRGAAPSRRAAEEVCRLR